MISNITLNDIKEHLRIEHDDEDNYLMTLLDTARMYVKNYTGLSSDELDNIEELASAVLMVVCDLYENRSATTDKNNLNKIYESILSMHSLNLI